MNVIRVLITVLAVAALALIAWGIGLVHSEQPEPNPAHRPAANRVHTVTYEVTGSTPYANLTYEHPAGMSQVGPVPLPWTWTFQAYDGQYLYISAQNDEDSIYLSVRITVDGVTVGQSESSGAYVVTSTDAMIAAAKAK